MKREKPKTESVQEDVTRCSNLTVERTFGSQDLIELVADYIAEKIEIEHPGEHQKCKRTDC
ncbi:MAG: hypothetical protein IJ325_07765 [Clostridia bacterium]|nr:hypothetical protein [Clostridia bacterium]